MIKDRLRSNNGITVLTLIITVILLLILAGVSLGTIFNSDGLLEKANDAASKYNQAKDDESSFLGSIMNEIDKYNGVQGGETTGTTTPTPSLTPSITPTPTLTPTPSPTPSGGTEKKDGRLILSAISGTVTYPNDGIFTIQENTSGGKLSVSSSDDSIATANITENTVTIIPKEISVSEKKVVVTVTSAETSTYKEQTAVYIATIKQNAITLEATVTTRQYDGTSFNAITSVKVVPEDAKLEYSLNNGEYQTTIPQVKDAGEYIVSIRGTKYGYETAEITKKVTIDKQEATTSNLTLSVTSGTITYPNEGKFTITNNASEGALFVQTSDTSIATASLNGQTVTITPQAVNKSGKTATITVISAETNNYKAQTATYQVTVNQGEITISATEYVGSADGNKHNAITEVSVNPTDATLTYSLNGGDYSSTIPQISSVGSYTLKIKATKTGWMDKEIEKIAVITKGEPPTVVLPPVGTTPPEEGWTIKQAQALVERDGLQAHLGEKVQYNPVNGGTWRIFYYDNEDDGNGNGYFGILNTLYLKRDYVSNSTSLKNYNTHISSDSGTVMRKMNPKWSVEASGNYINLNNEYAVSWLCDPGVWNEYYRVDGVADYVIGSPSVEMYMKAYNVYKDNNPNSSTLVNKVENAYGYKVGANGNYTNSGGRTDDNTIEAGPNSIFMTEGSHWWWLASPSSWSGDNVIWVRGNYARLDYNTYTLTNGICPVAAILNDSGERICPPAEGWTIEEAKALVKRDGLKPHIGARVQYKPKGEGTWRIFYYDDEDDGNGNGYFGKSGTLYLKRDWESKYILLSGHKEHNPSDNGTIMKKMHPKWAAATNGNAIDLINEHCVAWLCDPEEWNEECKVDGLVDYAIGSPSVEMYMKAYSAYIGSNTALINGIYGLNGYRVGASNSYSNNSGFSTKAKTINAGPHEIFVQSGSTSWWLASPSTATAESVLFISAGTSQSVQTGPYTNAKIGICPIVAVSK